MAFDAANHEINPATGFAVHKDDGHVIGLEQAPPAKPFGNPEWPKWVKVSDSQIVRQKRDGAPDHVSVPGWPNYHVDRTNGDVTVLVDNEDEEKIATSDAKAEDGNDVLVIDDATRRAVHADVERIKLEQVTLLNKEASDEQAALEEEEAARRVTENNERLAREHEAAEAMATKQRERLSKTLGNGGNAADYVPPPVAEPNPPTYPPQGLPPQAMQPSPGYQPPLNQHGNPAQQYPDPNAPGNPNYPAGQPTQPAPSYPNTNPQSVPPERTGR
jgi:hypothetical protein